MSEMTTESDGCILFAANLREFAAIAEIQKDCPVASCAVRVIVETPDNMKVENNGTCPRIKEAETITAIIDPTEDN